MTKAAVSKKEMFERMPVPKALSIMAIPTIISQLINLIYNIADTFFVGRTGNPYMIAAVSLSFTLFMFNTPISCLLGAGGGGYMAGLRGSGNNEERIKGLSAYCFWFTALMSVSYMLITGLFLEPILKLLGASESTLGFAKQYVLVLIVFGNLPVVLSQALGHLLRNAGFSKQASYGLSGGGLLNILLDPVFMFWLFPEGYEVLGAALATLLSNMITLAYFVVFIKRHRAETGISLSIRDVKASKEDRRRMFSIGIPFSLTTFLMDIANMCLNSTMAAYGDLELAALGITMKVERFANAISLGIAQGMLPLVAYNYSAGNFKRMQSFLTCGRIAGVVVSIIGFMAYQLFAKPLTSFFISNNGNGEEIAKTVMFGIAFLRIRSIAALATPHNLMNMHVLQALGDSRSSMIFLFLRQIVFYLPLLFIINAAFGLYGLVAAYPISEILSFIVSSRMVSSDVKTMKAKAA